MLEFLITILNTMSNIIIHSPLCWIVIILSIIVIVFYPKFRGYMGEFWVKQELNKLPKDKYLVLNDIMLLVNNKTVQINYIVISQ